MKLLIAVVIVNIVAANVYDDSKIENAIKECQSKYKIEREVVLKMRPDMLEKINNCYGACLYSKSGFVNEKSKPSIKILDNAIEAKSGPSNLDKFNNCINNNKNSDFCVQVVNTTLCIMQEIEIEH